MILLYVRDGGETESDLVARAFAGYMPCTDGLPVSRVKRPGWWKANPDTAATVYPEWSVYNPTLELTSRNNSAGRSEEHTSELQSLMRISYAVFCLKKKNK